MTNGQLYFGGGLAPDVLAMYLVADLFQLPIGRSAFPPAEVILSLGWEPGSVRGTRRNLNAGARP